jgi:hypothetical protein
MYGAAGSLADGHSELGPDPGSTTIAMCSILDLGFLAGGGCGFGPGVGVGFGFACVEGGGVFASGSGDFW